MGKVKTDAVAKEKIVTLYRDDLVPMAKIAEMFGVSRTHVWKILNMARVDTTKEGAGRIEVTCHCGCGARVMKHRNQVRRNQHLFASRKCFSRWLNRRDPTNPLITRRQGLRIAKKVVSEYFFVSPGMVVHHEDRNQNNNDISNLRVFASQGDHTRYHRGYPANCVFDGRFTKEKKISELEKYWEGVGV